ncbi:MAG: RNA polymerase factor sigma-54 [Bacteroidota bacterium]
MQRQNTRLEQKQSQQQKLSPQQIQFIRMLQLPLIGLEQRIKEELEVNPVLEEGEDEGLEESLDPEETWEADEGSEESGDPDPVDRNEEIDWESFLHNREDDGTSFHMSTGVGGSDDEWRDLPNPYHESLLEELEQQVSLLDFDETEALIADQILGSLDSDGYFRRETAAVIDNISFNHGVLPTEEQVERVRRQIQKLEPVGVASRDLQDCLLIQLDVRNSDRPDEKLARRVLREEWDAFKRKHFDRLKQRLDLSDDQLQAVFQVIQGLDPRPGAVSTPEEENSQMIEPDFEVYWKPTKGSPDSEEGEFVIQLTQRNSPPLRISPHYKEMWENLSGKSSGSEKIRDEKTRTFIREKVESAQWFIDSIRQRQQTLLNTMKAIVFLQSSFFRSGKGLRPMILKDVAERVHMDISTISRVVNGKYVQTPFGVFELKYFFSEGLVNDSGEEVSSREVKQLLARLIDQENKRKPLSDKELAEKLKEEGFHVARRTVSKYREQLQLPVARLRRELR